MDHPNSRLLARYALGEITDDEELTGLEDHLMACDSCRRRAVAVDLIGTAEESGELLLHIAGGQSEAQTALCGEDASRNVISGALVSGFDASLVCPKCMALARVGTGESTYVN